MSKINFKQIFKVIGKLLVFESLIILSTIIVSGIYLEEDYIYFIITSLIGLSIGLGLNLFIKNPPTYLGKREGALIVSLTWILFSFLGALPYWLSGAIPNFTDAFFESISGFTATGASILNNIEELSHGILFWRSMTHWIGGLGIIVISMAILPMIGINATNLFIAETTGPALDKISPKINDTARILLTIYTSLTLVETVLLMFGGMNFFDALCHSFATVATGGFSTKQASIGYWSSPYIQYVIAIFMLLSGINFSMFFLAYTRNFKKVFQNEEMKVFLALAFGASLVVFLINLDYTSYTFSYLEKTWRDTFFTVSSMLTSTGFGTVDYMLWKPITWVILAMLMFVGGSAGSTGGGAKVVRFLLAGKIAFAEFKKLIHPTAVIPVKYNKRNLQENLEIRVLAFLFLYVAIIAIGMLVLLVAGMGLKEAFGSVLTSLSGVGPAFGKLGPANNYADISTFSKWFMSFIMLVGRLELFTVLVIFTPTFWKK